MSDHKTPTQASARYISISLVIGIFLSIPSLLWCMDPTASNVPKSDVTDNCSDAQQMQPVSTYAESVNNGYFMFDHDWYKVVIPGGKSLVVTAIPESDLDIYIDTYTDCSATRVRENQNYIGGNETVVVRPDTAIETEMWFDVWGENSPNGNPKTSSYNMDFTMVDRDGLVATMQMNRLHFKWGYDFYVNLVIGNPSTVSKPVDVYVVMEFLGAYYYWPSWSTWPDALINGSIAPTSNLPLDNLMAFTVPNGFPTLGPITFYAAAYDRMNGSWSNIVSAQCYFQE